MALEEGKGTLKTSKVRRAWEYRLFVYLLRRLRQEDGKPGLQSEFKADLSYLVRVCLKIGSQASRQTDRQTDNKALLSMCGTSSIPRTIKKTKSLTNSRWFVFKVP